MGWLQAGDVSSCCRQLAICILLMDGYGFLVLVPYVSAEISSPLPSLACAARTFLYFLTKRREPTNPKRQRARGESGRGLPHSKTLARVYCAGAASGGLVAGLWGRRV